MLLKFLLLILPVCILSAVTEDNCEVCVKFVNKLYKILPEEDKSSSDKIEKHFKDLCKKSKGKDERLCYYIGGLPTSATYIVNELTKPMSWTMPAEKVCEKLKQKDSQICDLKYEKIVDLATANFKKLKVKELKKILDSWDEVCKGCTEKSDYIRMVEEKLPIYAPDVAAKRQNSDL